MSIPHTTSQVTTINIAAVTKDGTALDHVLDHPDAIIEVKVDSFE